MTPNERILEMIKTYPLGGGYTWNPKVPTSGVTRDLIYKNEKILSKDTATYCCGLTFEVWFRCFADQIDIAVDQMRRVQRLWYVAEQGRRGGCMDALMSINQAEQTVELKASALGHLTEIESGDFLQLWRTSGTGHSVIYISHDKEYLTYWSTQPSTKGIGFKREKLTALSELYFVRQRNIVTPTV